MPWQGVAKVQEAGPALVVVPFETSTGGESGRLLASGVTRGLIVDLMRFDGMQVFAGLDRPRQREPLPRRGKRRARI